MISKLEKFADAVLPGSFKFFFAYHELDETIAKPYFLAPFYCFGQLNHCLEISGNKDNLKTI